MNQKIKLGLYAALLLGAIVFGALFFTTYKRVHETPEHTNVPSEHLDEVVSNVAAADTNLIASTNPVPQTNEVAPETNEAPQLAPSNAPAEPVIETLGRSANSRQSGEGQGAMITYFAAFLGIAILLGLLIARDISEYFGSRSVEFMFNDEGTGIKDPEYEEAEQVWANGQHLDAVRLMRDYLNKHPREQHVALRIAEIYEKDLKNHLAAALEYEEILKNKLPPQRWGWAAIHLCNLYSKLKRPDDAVALLHRIANEYGETPAAEKARKRLAMFETVGEEGLEGEIPEGFEAPPPKPTKPIKVELKQDPTNKLPPGFGPKR